MDSTPSRIQYILVFSLAFALLTYYAALSSIAYDKETARHLIRTDAEVSTEVVDAVRPVWKCNDNNRNGTKFIFVHVFKTAGSSIRRFLMDYSHKCGAGCGTTVGCTAVNRSSMLLPDHSANWDGCILKEKMDRTGKIHNLNRRGKINNNVLRNDLDIVAGHLRLGTADHLKDENGKPINVRYLSFFRNAAEKYVSGKVYVKMKTHDTMTRDQVLEHIRHDVNTNVANGQYHAKYESYLLTPLQRDQAARQEIPRLDITRMIMNNLVEYNVICGMVERMPESMKVLSHVLDEDGSVRDVFDSYGMGDNNITESNKMNLSPVSASAILAEIKNDEEFYKRLLEYVKYEQMITDFAMELHMKQYQAVQRSKR